MVGLCLIAVFAIAAVTATSASALPEWGKCVSQAGGKYTNSNCTTKGKGGSFEWKKGATLKNVPFKGHNVGSGGVLSTTWYSCYPGTYQDRRVPRKKCEEGGGEVFNLGVQFKVECESEKNTGEASGKNSILNVAVVFKGCKIFGSSPCTSAFAAEGEIRVNPLKGSLGYINKAEKNVGVLLEPVAKHGTFATFECEGLETTVGVGNSKEGAFHTPESKGGYDGIISPITPVNTMTSEYEQVFTTNGSESEPANVPSKFEGKHIDLLEDYIHNVVEPPESSTMWLPAAEEITNVNESSEAGEIKA